METGKAGEQKYRVLGTKGKRGEASGGSLKARVTSSSEEFIQLVALSGVKSK